MSSPQKPIVVRPLEPLMVLEGEAAHLTCRIIGLPKPRVTWTIGDGRVPVSNGSRYKVKYDGIYQLTIPRTSRATDHGMVTLTAVNSFGETQTSAMLIVRPRNADYRAVLAHSPRTTCDDRTVSDYQAERLRREASENVVFEERRTTVPSSSAAVRTDQGNLDHHRRPDNYDEIVWYTGRSPDGAGRFKIREYLRDYRPVGDAIATQCLDERRKKICPQAGGDLIYRTFDFGANIQQQPPQGSTDEDSFSAITKPIKPFRIVRRNI